MDKRNSIVEGAISIFEESGFRGVGIDDILAPSGASTRTLYKHFGSRDALVQAVVSERHRQFMERLLGNSSGNAIGDLFDQLQLWLDEHGARGCMLLRARSEYADASAAIVALVREQKKQFVDEISRRVALTMGYSNKSLTVQIWLLFEGATAAASVSEDAVVAEARQAAMMLVAATRDQ